MAEPSKTLGSMRFGPFDLSVESGELRKNGLRLKLTGQPIQVLIRLVAKRGSLVTREELQRELWGSDIYGDPTHGLNAAVNRLREALGDSATEPRYIETVPGRGYRFVGTITQTLPVQVTATGTEKEKKEPSPQTSKRKLWAVGLGIAGLCALLAVGFYWLRFSQRLPSMLHYRELTKDRQVKNVSCGLSSGVVTDGPRVFFSEVNSPLMQVSPSGGDAVKASSPLPCFVILGISPDKTELLGLSSTRGVTDDQPLWILSIVSGLAHPLGNLSGHAGAWSPDGQKIVYATGQNGSNDGYDDLYTAAKDGSEARKLIRIEKGPACCILWSPDGKVLRMRISGKFWEVSADGTNLHPVELFPGENRFDGLRRGSKRMGWGNWTPDGKYFVFGRWDGQVREDLWALRETKTLFGGRTATPVQLTTGATSFCCPVPSLDGKQIFATGGQRRGELVRYDLKLRRLEPFLSGISADQLDFSKDGNWVTYVTFPELMLWRSRVDGSERMELTTSPSFYAATPHWSPDGTRIAFSGWLSGEPIKLYVVSAEGGQPEVVSQSQYDEVDATWSPDGNSLIFGERMQTAQTAISSVDLRTGRVSIIPGSEGLFSPRVSPNGRFIVALLSAGKHEEFLFDQQTQKWSELLNSSQLGALEGLRMPGCGWPQWSSDSKSVYCSSGGGDWHAPVLYRVRIADRKLERVASVDVPEGVTGYWWYWMSAAPDGSPLLLRDLSIEEIYALDVDLP
jgi:Tol biopolymer transport system component/DNA-binding winged helix-turn-helix (wHTH) protein